MCAVELLHPVNNGRCGAVTWDSMERQGAVVSAMWSEIRRIVWALNKGLALCDRAIATEWKLISENGLGNTQKESNQAGT